MLVNGVEILNYKSQEILYYGKVDNIEVLAPGSNYDIINPPELYLTDVVGTGATGYPAVNGGLQEIRLQDPGFDYETAPIITIKGGNGEGATAAANMKLIKHVALFGSGSVVGNVGVGTDLVSELYYLVSELYYGVIGTFSLPYMNTLASFLPFLSFVTLSG